MNELDAAGAAATAALAASVIEGRTPTLGAEGVCANCGAALSGRFCANCGQPAHLHRSLGHMFEEMLHGIIHFDAKAWRTLPMLIGRPGTLTRNYVFGKRARYISPLALFLFTVFLMFFVFAWSTGGDGLNVRVGPGAELQQMSDADLAKQLADARKTAADAQAEYDRLRGDRPADAPERSVETVAHSGVAIANRQVVILENEQARRAGRPINPAADERLQIGSWQDASRELAAIPNFTIIPGWTAFNERVRHKLENPEFAAYKIQQSAYKFSFLLIPISLPFVALLFLWKKDVTLYDHAVFTLYSLSFVSLVFVVISLLARTEWTENLIPPILLFGVPAHMFFHLKGAYALGWFSTAWRFVFLLLFALLSLVIFTIAILALGLAG